MNALILGNCLVIGTKSSGGATPPADFYYHQPGGVFLYRQPDGTSLYLQP